VTVHRTWLLQLPIISAGVLKVRADMSSLIGATSQQEIAKLAGTHGAETAACADYSDKYDMFKPVSRVLFEEPGGTFLFILIKTALYIVLQTIFGSLVWRAPK